MRVVVVTPPTPVVDLMEAKEHLCVDDDDSDFLVATYVEAATASIDGPDGWLGRAIGEQTLEAYCPAPALLGRTALPYCPVIEVEAVEARTGEGWTTIDPAAYELRGDWLLFRTSAEPAGGWAIGDGEGMRVRYRAGYENVPAPIRAAILLMTGDLFRNRDTTSTVAATKIPMTTTVENLLTPFRRWR
ncbi:head-tail connector protein [Sphingomonas melonis]|jgi:uncharacterized phiE125 gp8 family phage protein|uniref:head-tail connector protein n=1 Tax=Sphingomonas melonis TaxID=152682 RepID=UPI0003750094|nr:head-tail connector protein [Sphingomonas melonis]